MTKILFICTALFYSCCFSMQQSKIPLKPLDRLVQQPQTRFPAGIQRVIRTQSPGGTIRIKCINSPRAA